jgi:hypothetical protein
MCGRPRRAGRWYLLFARHPFCRYDYTLVPGKRLTAYGIEQQAMIVQHAFMLRRGGRRARRGRQGGLCTAGALSRRDPACLNGACLNGALPEWL